MTNRRGRGPDPNDDLTHLSDEDVERRLGGDAGLGGPVPERPAPLAPPAAPPGRSGRGRRGGAFLWRDVLLVLVLLGFLGAGAQFVLQRPTAAVSSSAPGGSEIAIASPTQAPRIATLPPPTDVVAPSDVIGSLPPEATPAPVPTPTPTLAPGGNPKPTPKPTTRPTATSATAHLTVSILVQNDQGGSDVASDWTVDVGGANPSSPSFPGSGSGTTITVTANTAFTISTTPKTPGGYIQSFTGTCAGPLSAGVSASCTIVEADKLAHLAVTVTGLPDASVVEVSITGSATLNATPASFLGSATGTSVSLWSNQSFTVSASDVDGYTKVQSALCSSSIGLSEGGSAHCFFTYSQDPTPAPAGVISWPLLALVGRRRPSRPSISFA